MASLGSYTPLIYKLQHMNTPGASSLAAQYQQENAAINTGLQNGTMTKEQANAIINARLTSWQENGSGKGNTFTSTQMNSLNSQAAQTNKTLGIA